MQKVKIFTNSCSDMSPAIAEEFGVSLIPDTIIFDGTLEYRTNIDITPMALYPMMDKYKDLPTSSHPNISVYESCFKTASDYEEILCLNLTSVMSGTYSTACTAAKMMLDSGFGPKIYPYDTLQLSYGLSLLVMHAARLARDGKSAEEIIASLDERKKKVGVYFILKSLHNARKGGRIGAVRVLAADILGIKPLMIFRDGTLRDIGIMRNFGEGINGMIEKYKNTAQFGGDIFIYHADNIADARLLEYKLREIDKDAKIRIEWVGSAIGVYTGRGCIGIAFMEK
ncbi:MAG: DegV family protein [Clostridiaceae bacterium]|nr:DegV family protein [Clostridiaceae bacterium]